MTENDNKLIDEAEHTSRYAYRDVDDLIRKADTAEAREILWNIRWELYDLMMETI